MYAKSIQIAYIHSFYRVLKAIKTDCINGHWTRAVLGKRSQSPIHAYC